MRQKNIKQALLLAKVRPDILKTSHSYSGEDSGWVTLKCPFASHTHKNKSDSHPSFGVSFDSKSKSFYNCFSCGQKGRLIDLPINLAKIGVKEYDNLLSVVSEISSLENEEALTIRSKVDKFSQFRPDSDLIYLTQNPMRPASKSKQAMAYLSERNVSAEVADYLDLGYNSEMVRVSFPVKWVDGSILGYVQRLAYTKDQLKSIHSMDRHFIDKTPKVLNTEEMAKDFCLLGLDKYSGHTSAVVVEGPFALARLVTLFNGHNIDILPLALLGTNFKESQAKLLSAIFRRVHILLDNDKAGKQSTLRLAKSLESHGVIVNVFDWHKTPKADVDDFELSDLSLGGIIKSFGRSNTLKNKMKQGK